MSTSIIYTDKLGNRIPQEVIDAVDRYSQTIGDGDKKIKINCIQGGNLAVTYYISSADEIPMLLADRLQTHIEIETSINSYESTEYFHYENSVLTHHSRHISDIDNNIICEIDYNEASGEITRIEKTYCTVDKDIYDFFYDESGNLSYVWEVTGERRSNHIYPEDFEKNPALKSFWDGLDYYRTAEPLIPNNSMTRRLDF